MNTKQFIISLVFLTVGTVNSFAQYKYSKFSVDRQMKDTFLFATQWDYSWDVFKDNSTGKFIRNDDQSLTPADTARLFYTANCLTNVQGGYHIRYCFADQSKGFITLTFSDGLPAYASKFYVYIKGDSFYFKPNTIYPLRIVGQKVSYQVVKQELTLNKSNYKIADKIIGYVDAEFIETISVPKKGTKKNRFYLKGYIRTPLKQLTE